MYPFRLKLNREGPQPLLISFTSTVLRQAINNTRQPKRKLLFCNQPISLVAVNVEILRKVRQPVKNRNVHVTLVRDGSICIKWID